MLYQEGYRLAVVGEPGRKWIPFVILDGAGLRLDRMPRAAERGLQVPAGRPSKSTLARVARKFLAYGRQVGMTRGARELLELAAKGGAP